MVKLLSSTYMLVENSSASELAKDIDKATMAGFRLQGGIAITMRPHPFGGEPIMWYAQALVFEMLISEGGG